MNDVPILSLVVFTPLVGALVILFVPGSSHGAIRGVAPPATIGADRLGGAPCGWPHGASNAGHATSTTGC